MADELATLEDLYVDELQDLYHAEQQLAGMLPEMAKRARGAGLKESFTKDAERTGRHVQRLEQVLLQLGCDPSGHQCKGMEGLLQEGRERMAKESNARVLDAGLIVMAQKAQHYEIAGYGSACTFANVLNRVEEARLLHRTLEEEKRADEEFSLLAKDTINTVAANA
jgi:ferritin-like metal-binding protein YciE